MARAGWQAPQAIASSMYRSLGVGAFELLWVLGRAGRPLAARVSLAPELVALLGKERAGTAAGLVLATAHTGNWDLSACAVARAGFPLTIVTKRLKVRWLDDYWQRARRREGIELVEGAGAFACTLAAVRRGRAVALIIDQAPERHRGVTQTVFLGAVARCDRTAAVLAARTGATLALVLGRRRSDGTHIVEVRLALRPPHEAGPAWVEMATVAMQTALEQFVREYPDQWLWLHRRWKDRPPAPARHLVTARGQS